MFPFISCVSYFGLSPLPSNSHHQDFYVLIGDLNLHLPTLIWPIWINSFTGEPPHPPGTPPVDRTRSAAKDTARVKVLPSMTCPGWRWRFSHPFSGVKLPTCWMKTTQKTEVVYSTQKGPIGFGWHFSFCMGTRYHVPMSYRLPKYIWHMAGWIYPACYHPCTGTQLDFSPKKMVLPLSGFKNVSEDVWTVPANYRYSPRLTTTQALRLPWGRPIWAWRPPRHLGPGPDVIPTEKSTKVTAMLSNWWKQTRFFFRFFRVGIYRCVEIW